MKAKPQGGALYVYAIGEQAQLRKVLSAKDTPDGLADTPVALVTAGKLAAAVSEVPLTEFGEGPFETKLKDPLWAAEKVMRHEKVTEFLSSKTAVVPLRFGVMYTSPERIREMLQSRQSRLVETLNRISEHEEWSLNVTVDRKALHGRMSELSPRLAEMHKRVKASSPGQAYLLEKKLDGLRTSESKTETKRVANEVRDALRSEAQLLKELTIREAETKQDPAVVGKLSFLIAKKKLKPFRKTAETLARKYAPFGFRFELTGPWPPYNFSE